MRLYGSKIPIIADEILRELSAQGAIELGDRAEAQADVEAVLKEFLRIDREVTEEAKDRLARRGLGYEHLRKMKSEVARERRTDFKPDDPMPYLVGQILEMLFHSVHVEEIFAEDRDLRVVVTRVLRKHMQADDGIDREVRAKIKNLQEGTTTFEIEYQRVLEQIKRKRGLSG